MGAWAHGRMGAWAHGRMGARCCRACCACCGGGAASAAPAAAVALPSCCCKLAHAARAASRWRGAAIAVAHAPEGDSEHARRRAAGVALAWLPARQQRAHGVRVGGRRAGLACGMQRAQLVLCLGARARRRRAGTLRMCSHVPEGDSERARRRAAGVALRSRARATPSPSSSAASPPVALARPPLVTRCWRALHAVVLLRPALRCSLRAASHPAGRDRSAIPFSAPARPLGVGNGALARRAAPRAGAAPPARRGFAAGTHQGESKARR
jgi:hypothetical protein